MKALEEFGLQDAVPLDAACAAKCGGPAEARHQMKLEARRRRYAATAPGPRQFPTEGDFIRAQLASGKWVVIPYADWGTRDYVTWFEQANSLKRVGGDQE